MGAWQPKKGDGENQGQKGFIAGESELLFELALAGIGGNTIHQVKTNLTMVEINQWAEYRSRRGSLNTGRRVEQTAANMMSVYMAAVHKHEIEPLELMPYEDDVEIGFEAQFDD